MLFGLPVVGGRCPEAGRGAPEGAGHCSGAEDQVVSQPAQH